MKALKLIVAAMKADRTAFVGIREYTNEQGEESNQTIIINANMEKMLANDLIKILAVDTTDLVTDEFTEELIEIQKNKITESLKKRTAPEETKTELLAKGDKTMKASKAQTDAYDHLFNGLKVNKETNELYVFGYLQRKKIIKYSDKVSEDKRTLNAKIKSAIEKKANIRSAKYRNFIVNNAKEIAINGTVIN